MIEIRNVHSYYGAIEALKGVDLTIKDGDMCCVIGSNGAGKSTLLKSISNMVAHTGTISVDGQEIQNIPPTKIAKKGIVHVPEGRHVFPKLTVEQNLEVGSISWHGFFGHGSYAKELETVFDLFPVLKERRRQQAWSLSGGEQQMLAMGRALMARPRILLLDEPSMGLAPKVIAQMFEKIVEIHRQGITILLVEQNARLALRVSDYAYILDQGRITAHGPANELASDERILSAYLGSNKNGRQPS